MGTHLARTGEDSNACTFWSGSVIVDPNIGGRIILKWI